MKEKLQEYALIAEIIGGVAVVASLIFVGIQISQNNNLMAAEARYNKLSASKEAFNILSTNGELAEIMIKWDNNEPLTEVEEYRASHAQYRTLANMEWMYREMPLDSPERRNLRQLADGFIAIENNKKLFERRKQGYDEGFVAWIESMY